MHNYRLKNPVNYDRVAKLANILKKHDFKNDLITFVCVNNKFTLLTLT